MRVMQAGGAGRVQRAIFPIGRNDARCEAVGELRLGGKEVKKNVATVRLHLTAQAGGKREAADMIWVLYTIRLHRRRQDDTSALILQR